MTPKFADMIRLDAGRELLNVRVIQRDVFSTMDDLRRDYQLILLSEVVSDFRTTQQLRGLFELAAQCLAPGGRLVFNAFLAARRLHPRRRRTRTRAANVHQHLHAATRYPCRSAVPSRARCRRLGIRVRESPLPDGAWPPTSWYAEWVSGQDVFDVERRMPDRNALAGIPEGVRKR